MSDASCDPTLTDCPAPCDPTQGSCSVSAPTTTSTVIAPTAPPVPISKLPAASEGAAVFTVLAGVFYSAAGLLNIGYTKDLVNLLTTDATILSNTYSS